MRGWVHKYEHKMVSASRKREQRMREQRDKVRQLNKGVEGKKTVAESVEQDRMYRRLKKYCER